MNTTLSTVHNMAFERTLADAKDWARSQQLL